MITVLLTKDVDGCGRAGEIHTVSDGFARNCLLRNSSAIVATPEQVKAQQAQIAKREEERAAQKGQAERVTRLLDGKTITISAKHDHETLFAAVDAEQIAQELSTLIDETVSPEVVVIETAIKKIGDHEAKLVFDADTTATIRVTVTAA